MEEYFRWSGLKATINATRRNHALEHATIHLLSQRLPGVRMVGRSTAGGFWLYGAIPVDLLRQMTEEALSRLQGGERRLAIHENCGTNIVALGLLAGVGGTIALSGNKKRPWWDRLNVLTNIAILSAMLSYPFGYWLQEHVTTRVDNASGRIVAVEEKIGGQTPTRFVRIAWGPA